MKSCRFSYYDINYRRAGDTEFKNLVLPHNIASQLGNDEFNPDYDIFYDNRHEQHANLWKTELRKG